MADNSTVLGQNYVKVPTGTTAERPASAANGYIRYNITTNYLEYYSNGAWTSIAAPPAITSVSPTSYNGEQGTSITINGSFFDSGASVKFITAQNVEYTAATTTYVSQSQLTATTPQDFTVANEPLKVKVINASGLSYQLDNAIDCGGAPTWVTAAGSLGSVGINSAVSFTVSASDPDAGATISYNVTSGSLPSGTSLNSSTGVISGTAPNDSTDTTYNFTITATDNAGNTSSRAFSITTVVPAPTWNTASGSLGSDYTQRNSSFTVSATPNAGTISYSVVSGSVPTGQSLNSASGVISGTASGVSDYSNQTFNFTVRATNSAGKSADRSFSILIYSRYVGYSCSTANEGGTVSVSAPGGNIFNRRDFSSYGTPEGGCGGFYIGGCNSGSSNNWNGPIGNSSGSVGANNGNWGDPCGGVGKRMYIQFTYGPF